MPREIWNEGRVVGESAYEIYVKQHLAEDPNSPPATEKEWLASSLAMGASMVLKVPSVGGMPETRLTCLDIKLPRNSNLAAANTIVASYFDGFAEFPAYDPEHSSDSMWATKITDYGVLISNNSIDSPDTGYVGPEASYTTGMPTQVLYDRNLDKIRDYMHIIDGVVIQPGNWSENSSYPPAKDFKPDLTYTYPRVRLLVRGNINSNPLVLLTGFTLNSVLSGCVGTEGSTNTAHPENGDFLGPAEFPWAAKIVFSVPNSFLQYNLDTKYVRTIHDSAEVKDNAIIDMVDTDPKDFYEDYNTFKWSIYHPVTYPIPGSSDLEIMNPKYPIYVSELVHPSGAASAALTVLSKNDYYPPALWGTRITSTGNTSLYPLDVVAPGTIKMFNNMNEGVLQDYQMGFPGTWAMNHTNDNHIQILDDSDPENPQFVTLANQGDMSVSSVKLTNNNTVFDTPFKTYNASSNHPRMMQVQVGSTKGYGLMLSSNGAASSPTPYTISAVPSSVLNVTHSITHDSTTYTPNDNLAWSTLLNALIEDKSIDLLGSRLKMNKYSQIKSVIKGSGSTDDWEAAATVENLYDSSLGSAYLQFGSEVHGSDDKFNVFFNKNEPGPRTDYTFGVGWGEYASYVMHSNEWVPKLGGEYRHGIVDPRISSTQPRIKKFDNSDTTKYFGYGLVIFGKTTYSGIADFKDVLLANTSTGKIDYAPGSGQQPLPSIAFIDQWGGQFYIYHNDCYDIEVQNIGSGSERITNGVWLYNNTDYHALYIMIGKVYTEL